MTCLIIHILYKATNANALRTLYCSLFLPYISYCAEVLGNTYPSNILPVLLRQKKAVKIIARAEYLDHTEKLFYDMKLLTVNQIIELQSLTFMCWNFKELLPVNLQAHFNLNTGNNGYQNNFKCQYSLAPQKSIVCLLLKKKA